MLENRLLRRTFDPKKDAGEGKLRNEVLHNFYSSNCEE
jgi:hypothetical protein